METWRNDPAGLAKAIIKSAGDAGGRVEFTRYPTGAVEITIINDGGENSVLLYPNHAKELSGLVS